MRHTASVLGFGVSKGVAAYAVAQAGVVQLTRALALELAPKGVRVNAIAPGWFVTEINDATCKARRGRRSSDRSGDLDGALLLLVSKAGAYMTGTTVIVDGGQLVALG